MKILEKEQLSKLNKIIEKAKKSVIVSHVNPDGDAIGSSLALCRLLNMLGHECRVIIPNQSPAFLSWMPGFQYIINYEQDKLSASQWIQEAKLFFALDFNSLERIEGLGEMIKKNPNPKVLIDHHPGPDPFADFTISRIKVSSTAELVMHFMVSMGFSRHVDKDISACIYTGIMTDTVGFKHNMHVETFHILAQLVAHGIDIEYIHGKVYNTYPVDRMRLLGYCLQEKMKVIPELYTGYISLSQGELKRFNHETGDTEGFVNYPLSIENVRFSALFIEKEDHVKISFRSKGDFGANDFAAKYFEGGGHCNAAGGKSRLSMKETLDTFEQLVKKHAKEL